MHTTTETDTPTGALVATRFLEALARQQFDELHQLLADDVWLRALLTREIVEAHDSDTAARLLRQWHGGTHGFVVLDRQHDTIQTRELVRFRFAELPAWAPGQWHVIEQTGYLRVRDGRISRLDLVCTGYHQVSGPESTTIGS